MSDVQPPAALIERAHEAGYATVTAREIYGEVAGQQRTAVRFDLKDGPVPGLCLMAAIPCSADLVEEDPAGWVSARVWETFEPLLDDPESRVVNPR